MQRSRTMSGAVIPACRRGKKYGSSGPVVSRAKTSMRSFSMTRSVLSRTTGVPVGQRSESSPQLATTAVPSVIQIAEARVSGRISLHAPNVASGARP